MSSDHSGQDSEDQGSSKMVSTEGVIISMETMKRALDTAFENASEHRRVREGIPYEGRAQAIGACQMNMTGMTNAAIQGLSLEGPSARLAGAAIYSLATHMAVMEKVEQERRDAAKRSGSILSLEEAQRSGVRGGDSAGISVRRPPAPSGENSRGVGEDGS